jgi:hypothetical protein
MSSAMQTSASRIKVNRPGILPFMWIAPPATASGSIAEFQPLRYCNGSVSTAPTFIHGSLAEAHPKLPDVQP